VTAGITMRARPSPPPAAMVRWLLGERNMRAILMAAIAVLASAAAQAQVREVIVIHLNQQRVVQFSEPTARLPWAIRHGWTSCRRATGLLYFKASCRA
jgi:hypothetical protein